jgi:hypothetical protein
MTGVQVETYPDNPRDYKLTHPRAAILVRYGGAVLVGRQSGDGRAAARRVRVIVSVVARGLMGDGAAMDLLDELRSLLIGYCPGDDMRTDLEFSGESYVSDFSGVWVYEQEWLTSDVVRFGYD